MFFVCLQNQRWTNFRRLSQKSQDLFDNSNTKLSTFFPKIWTSQDVNFPKKLLPNKNEYVCSEEMREKVQEPQKKEVKGRMQLLHNLEMITR